MNMIEKLIAIQNELEAPKTQYNSFGKYYYRNCEDILGAVKPLLKKYQLLLTITDEIIYKEGRYYVQATATIHDVNGEKISVSAEAREALEKKGMDESQITGAASSYGRKYALNGLFAIDDTKDADADGDKKPKTQEKEPEAKKQYIPFEEIKAKIQSMQTKEKVLAYAGDIKEKYGAEECAKYFKNIILAQINELQKM